MAVQKPPNRHNTTFLGDDASHNAGADGTATFADSEAQAFFHSDRSDQGHFHRYVVTRQNHFLVSRQLDRASHVSRTEVELRTVALEERSEEHTSELQSRENLVCRLLLEKKKKDRLP